MFAVIKTGGKQYRVAADDLLKIEKLPGDAGDIVEFGEVMMVGVGSDTTIGAPFVDGALVTAEVVTQGRTRKIIAFKKRRRQNSRRTIGHRQHLTTVRIAEILTGGAKPKKAVAKKAPLSTDKTETTPSTTKAKSAPKTDVVETQIVDDIKLIGGVGPALEKKLNGVGITSLKELSRLSAKKLTELDDELKLGGRTERDEWVKQAKELLAGKPPRAQSNQNAAAAKK
ncbi:MAG: 50S ribosomal protein L21 [Hyphomicrobiales bacterium]|nr:50S ribosomal protein L21 [Hyphomicrobiales bacterium]